MPNRASKTRGGKVTICLTSPSFIDQAIISVQLISKLRSKGDIYCYFAEVKQKLLPQIDEAPISKFPEFFKQVLKEEKQLFDNTQAKTFKIPDRDITFLSRIGSERALSSVNIISRLRKIDEASAGGQLVHP
jgi:hypothetical protein